MKIMVMPWFYKKEQNRAGKYNWTLCWDAIYEPDNDQEPVAYYLYGDKVKETENAIQYNLSFWNLNKAGKYITDAPVEKRWKTWVPKAVLL